MNEEENRKGGGSTPKLHDLLWYRTFPRLRCLLLVAHLFVLMVLFYEAWGKGVSVTLDQYFHLALPWFLHAVLDREES